MAKDYPKLGVGLHFTLTAGKPVLSPQEVPTLVDENGGIIHNNGILKTSKHKMIF